MDKEINLLEDKYIKLLLERCLNFKKSKSLFISYDKVNKNFVDKVVSYAKGMGIDDIKLEENDIYTLRNKLDNLSLEEIENDKYFDKSIWDVYAKKDASFLMLETEFPGVMDGVDEEKFVYAKSINRKTRKLFREKETTYQIPWCFAALPNQIWADNIFKNDPNSYNKLFKVICSMCMVDTDDPIASWNEYIKISGDRANKLNSMKIKKLHYTNSLGTDLYVGIPDDAIWVSVGSGLEQDMLVNMPSYEIFTSPDYLSTEGIVYSSRPLMYGGSLIDNFYIKFKQGKVIDFNAEVGLNILKGIIESDDKSCYLGEIALVDYDSPISNTKLIFGNTLFDENASCHLAFGDAFPTCLKNGLNMTREELLKKGINHSNNHVDFMIGTSDLKIEAETVNGKITLFENGNFTI